MASTLTRGDHICVSQAVCFQCFKAGMEKVRARREAWAQRSLPFEDTPKALTPRAIAHRAKMLAHLARLAQRA
jgi:hypothetical protein